MALAAGSTFLLLSWRGGRKRRARHFTLATYNLQGFETRLDSLMAVIHELDVDILALQELSTAAATRIRQDFAEEYPYMALHPDDTQPIDGQGVLSRYPIEDSQYWMGTMGYQRAVIRIKQQPLTLFNAHPPTPLTTSYAQRAQEITDLLQRAHNTSGPIILAGDFNMEEWSEDYARITTYYDDIYTEVGRGRGYTFPDSVGGIPALSWFARPMVRLDYIFHNKHIHPIKAYVWPRSGGSDHRPVRARLMLKN